MALLEEGLSVFGRKEGKGLLEGIGACQELDSFSPAFLSCSFLSLSFCHVMSKMGGVSPTP